MIEVRPDDALLYASLDQLGQERGNAITRLVNPGMTKLGVVHQLGETTVPKLHLQRPTGRGPEDWFTGEVLIDALRDPDEQSAIGCAHVRFAPGARTAWHHHPKGQTLYITDGVGLVATRGGPSQEIRPGDVVYIEPGEQHWHGARPDRYMAHVAMQEADHNGQVVTWLEQVSDDDYFA